MTLYNFITRNQLALLRPKSESFPLHDSPRVIIITRLSQVFANSYMYISWIMYLMGGLDRDIGRYIGRCIDRYVGRYSVEYRSSIDRVSVDTWSGYRLTVGRVSAVCRSTRRPICVSTDMVVISLTLGRYLIDTLPIVYRYLTDT